MAKITDVDWAEIYYADAFYDVMGLCTISSWYCSDDHTKRVELVFNLDDGEKCSKDMIVVNFLSVEQMRDLIVNELMAEVDLKIRKVMLPEDDQEHE